MSLVARRTYVSLRFTTSAMSQRSFARHWCVAWLSPVPISRFSVVSGSLFVLQCCLELSPLFRDALVVSRVLLSSALLMELSTSSSEEL